MTVHLAAPLRLDAAGALATLAQDSPAEVGQSVALLAATRVGERVSAPAYGTPDPVFAGLRRDALDAALALWEPRAADGDLAVDDLDEVGVEQSVTVLVGGE